MKIKKKTKRLIVQFGEYMVTGGVWFWSGYILIVLLDNHIGLFWANFIGNGVGLTLNFILERYWVFRTKRPAKLAIATRRYLIYTFLNAFLLNYLILYYLREAFGIGTEYSQFIASAFFTFWNWFWYRNWVFKGRERPRKTRTHA